MGKTNLDELELSGGLTAESIVAENITASGTLEYDSLAVTGDISGATITTTGNGTIGGALTVTQGLSAVQVSSSGDILAAGDIVANGELRAYDNVTFGEAESTVDVDINGGLTVTGDATAATLTTTGKVTVGGNLQIEGDPIFNGILPEIFGTEEDDATDEATAIALVNDIKAKYNLLLTYLQYGEIGP